MQYHLEDWGVPCVRSYLYGAAARGSEDCSANPLSGYGVGAFGCCFLCLCFVCVVPFGMLQRIPWPIYMQILSTLPLHLPIRSLLYVVFTFCLLGFYLALPPRFLEFLVQVASCSPPFDQLKFASILLFDFPCFQLLNIVSFVAIKVPRSTTLEFLPQCNNNWLIILLDAVVMLILYQFLLCSAIVGFVFTFLESGAPLTSPFTLFA